MTNAEIQVGEYVRTNNGSIFKIIAGNADDYLIDVDYHDLQKMEDDIYDELMWLNYNDNGSFIRRIVKNHSFNIIDLIEVGDYVKLCARLGNKEYVDDVCSYVSNVGEYNGKTFIELDYGQDGTEYFYDTTKIKTIVTHEQMKAMEYKVGGEEVW